MEVLNMRAARSQVLSRTDAQLLSRFNGDVSVLQPYIGRKGRCMIDVPCGHDDNGDTVYRPMKHPVANAQSLLRKDEWIRMEAEMQTIALPELNFASDLMSIGRRPLPNPFRVTVLQYQKRGQAGSATRSMDLLRRSNTDRYEFSWDGVPIPFTHGEFSASYRELEVSRAAGMGIDTGMLEEETRRIAELTEDWAIGTEEAFKYAGYSAPGALNHPDIISASMTDPTDAGWTPEDTYFEVLGILQSLADLEFSSPVGVYYSRAWAQYLARPYSAVDKTPLRKFLNDGVGTSVSYWRQLARLGSGFKMLFVGLDRRYVGMIDGMPIRPVQWTSGNGMEVKWLLYQCQIPLFRSDASGNLPVVYAT